MKNIVSVSFGKDSLALLLRMMEEGMPIDEVVYFDTGMEFSCIYTIKRKAEQTLKAKGIPFTVLTGNDFLHRMFDHEVKHRDGTTSKGYKWCGGPCRWYTTEKTRMITKYLNDKYGKGNYKEFVGIAHDEPQRAERALKAGKAVPLVEWKMTEADCLAYCHDRGFEWIENGRDLYKDLDRVSCWICRNKNLKELQNIFENHKAYWFALCEIERRCGMKMKGSSLLELEKKWKEEKS